jgi:alcohol dehydrogenase class IV
VDKLKDIVAKENAAHVALFTDKGVRKAGLVDETVRCIEATGAELSVIDDIAQEPSYLEVQKAVDELGVKSCDMIVAVGGGSVMDAAKLCSMLAGGKYSVKDMLDDPAKAQKAVRSVMLPTTCGTGSEATCNAIVSVPEQGVKVGIVNDGMIPDYVLLDPNMIKFLPPAMVAATGVDALAHAVECYTSNKANPVSDIYAMASAKLIFGSLVRAWQTSADMKAKTDMLIGAYYGGMAITASGTTAVHALSYPLGGKFHIPHGVSNAILFAPVMAFNMDACEERLAEICDAVKPEMYGKTVTEKAQIVVDEIANIVRQTEIPTNLSGFGVTASDLDFLTESAGNVTRLLNNNRKKLTAGDIRSIYEKVL